MAFNASILRLHKQHCLMPSLSAALRHSEVTAAKAKGQVEGQKDNLVGNVKEGAGKLTGNKETEAKVGAVLSIRCPVCSLSLFQD